MQVTQQASHLTHAVINAGEQISFGVSDDPMFFHMMYSSLYGNPMRAAFREPLCNAWDANIDNGKEDVPLEITLTESSVTIKDSGKGIPHDKIGEIYLTLGKSTKVNDSGQTGGFGLGCKAPFAYADHFEVRSSFNGMCTIYRLIKVCPTKGGRPSATVVASFPTKETGLTVTIPFQIHGHDESGNPISRDYPKIKRLIMEAISQGGILANVNEIAVPLLPLDRKPGSWAISDSFGLSQGTSNRVFVRYGSVVYPVETMEGLENYGNVRNILRNSFYSGSMEIVFQAPPDSIVIPPSREAISAHPKTAETLTKLFSDFVEKFEESQKRIPGQAFREVLLKLKNLNSGEFWHIVRSDLRTYMPHNNLMDGSQHLKRDTVLLDTDEIAGVALYQKSSPFSRYDHDSLTDRLRLKVLYRMGYLSKHMLGLLCHKEAQGSNYWHSRRNWGIKYIIKPLVKRMMRAGLNPKNLCVFNGNANRSSDAVVAWENSPVESYEGLIAMARKQLVIAYSKGEVWDLRYGTKHQKLAQSNGGRMGILVYLCPKSNGSSARARDVFAKFTDWDVTDLTVEKDEENAEMRRKRSAAAKAKREKAAALQAAGLPPEEPEAKVEKQIGFPNLRNGMDGSYFNFRCIKASGHYRVEKPRFWVDRPNTPSRQQAAFLHNCTRSETVALLAPFLSEGILIQNQTQQKYVDKHQLPEFKEYLMQYLERNLRNCKQYGLQEGLKVFNISRAVRPNDEGLLISYKTRIVQLIIRDSWLRAKFGIKRRETSYPVDRDVQLLKTLLQSNYLGEEDKERMQALATKITTPIVSDEAKALFCLVSSNPRVRYLNTEHLEECISSKDKNTRMAARKFIMNTLNNK